MSQCIRNLVRAIAQASLACTRWETKVMLASYQEDAR